MYNSDRIQTRSDLATKPPYIAFIHFFKILNFIIIRILEVMHLILEIVFVFSLSPPWIFKYHFIMHIKSNLNKMQILGFHKTKLVQMMNLISKSHFLSCKQWWNFCFKGVNLWAIQLMTTMGVPKRFWPWCQEKLSSIALGARLVCGT